MSLTDLIKLFKDLKYWTSQLFNNNFSTIFHKHSNEFFVLIFSFGFITIFNFALIVASMTCVILYSFTPPKKYSKLTSKDLKNERNEILKVPFLSSEFQRYPETRYSVFKNARYIWFPRVLLILLLSPENPHMWELTAILLSIFYTIKNYVKYYLYLKNTKYNDPLLYFFINFLINVLAREFAVFFWLAILTGSIYNSNYICLTLAFIFEFISKNQYSEDWYAEVTREMFGDWCNEYYKKIIYYFIDLNNYYAERDFRYWDRINPNNNFYVSTVPKLFGPNDNTKRNNSKLYFFFRCIFFLVFIVITIVLSYNFCSTFKI